MFLIQQIGNSPKQSQTLQLPDGTSFYLEIYFSKMQLGWFIEELTYGSFTVKSIRIYNGINLLRQFKNKIPFGLACISVGDIEPMHKESFKSGDSKLYILTEQDVLDYEAYLRG